MKFDKRTTVSTLLLLALCPLAAQAQQYPNRPIKVLVGFAAGGGTDIVARVVGKNLGDVLGQPIVIENKPGASGMIANEIIAKAPTDGYSLMVVGAGPMTISPNLLQTPTFDALKDFQPISMFGIAPFVLVVNPSMKVNTVAEFTALAKAQPGKLNFASSGTAGSPHMAGELYKRQAGVDIVHVPYKGLQPAVVDVVAGQVQAVFADLSVVLPLIQGGKLKPLAVTSAKRSSFLPNVPTMAEAGLPDYRAETWYGLVAPAGIPAPIVKRLNEAVRIVLASPDIKANLASQGFELAPSTPDEFSGQIRHDYNKWSALIKDAGIKLSN